VTCARRSLFVEVSGNASKLMNDATTSGFVDSNTQGISVAAGYAGQRLGDLAITGTYSTISYGQDPLVGVKTPAVQQYSVGLRYSRKLGHRLSGTASASWNRVEGGFGGAAQDGLNASAVLQYTLTSRMQFSLNYVLANSASPLANTSYVRNESFQLSSVYTLTQRLSLNASVSRSQQNYREAQKITALELSQSTADMITGGVNMKIARKTSISLSATRTIRTADLSQFNYSDDRVAATLTSRF
jgi:hypothetical protein